MRLPRRRKASKGLDISRRFTWKSYIIYFIVIAASVRCNLPEFAGLATGWQERWNVRADMNQEPKDRFEKESTIPKSRTLSEMLF